MIDAASILHRFWSPLVVRRILVFDDDESVTASVRKWMTPFPCRIDSTRDNSGACAMIGDASHDRPYDVIISDLCQSFESASAILSLIESGRSRLPIVLTCELGFDPAPLIAKARHVGLRVFLYKPFGAEQLFNAICQVIDDGQS